MISKLCSQNPRTQHYNPERDQETTTTTKLFHEIQHPGIVAGLQNRRDVWGEKRGRNISSINSTILYLPRYVELNATIYLLQQKASNKITLIIMNELVTSALDGIFLSCSSFSFRTDKGHEFTMSRVLGIYIKLPLDIESLQEGCEI